MVEISKEEWQSLHDKAFEQRVLDGVWSRIAWIGGSIGIASIAGVVVMLWGPIKTQIISDINKEVFQKLTSEAEQRLRDYATQVVATEAAKRVNADLQQPDSALRRTI